MRTKIAHLIYWTIKQFVKRKYRITFYGHCKVMAALIDKMYTSGVVGDKKQITEKFEVKSYHDFMIRPQHF